MKKRGLFIALAIIAVIIVVVIILFTVLNKEKEAITANEFSTIMQSKGYTIIDAKEQFDSYDYIENAYIATLSSSDYQIEFYEMSNNDYAVSFYNNNKSIFESSKGNASGETSVSMANYSKYTLSTNGMYKVLSRINNTVIYMNVDSEYKDTVKSILDELGY